MFPHLFLHPFIYTLLLYNANILLHFHYAQFAQSVVFLHIHTLSSWSSFFQSAFFLMFSSPFYRFFTNRDLGTTKKYTNPFLRNSPLFAHFSLLFVHFFHTFSYMWINLFRKSLYLRVYPFVFYSHFFTQKKFGKMNEYDIL